MLTLPITCEVCDTTPEGTDVAVTMTAGAWFARVNCRLCTAVAWQRVSGHAALIARILGADEVDPSEKPLTDDEIASAVKLMESTETLTQKLGIPA